MGVVVRNEHMTERENATARSRRHLSWYGQEVSRVPSLFLPFHRQQFLTMNPIAKSK